MQRITFIFQVERESIKTKIMYYVINHRFDSTLISPVMSALLLYPEIFMKPERKLMDRWIVQGLQMRGHYSDSKRIYRGPSLQSETGIYQTLFV